MAVYLDVWKTKEDAERELSKRWNFASTARKPFEDEWRACEEAVFTTNGGPANIGAFRTTDYQENNILPDNPDLIAVNYVMKNIRFLHSQLALNPPIVAPRPLTADPDDFRRADSADRIAQYGMRQYKMQDTTDLVTFQALALGTAVGYSYFNPEIGEVISYSPESGEIEMEGDFEYEAGNLWDYYPDPDATRPEKRKWFFRQFYMPYEEACQRWPSLKDELKSNLIEEKISTDERAHGVVPQTWYQVVRTVQYWETGLPTNGMAGRFAWCLVCDGSKLKLLEEVQANPHSFPRALKPGEVLDDATGNVYDKEGNEVQRVSVARLPAHIITDIDVPNCQWGKSVVAYALALQRAANRIDTVTLDILKAHGVARIITFDGSEIAEDSITNNPLDIIKVEGNTPPQYMEPMPLPAAMPNFRELARAGIDDLMGVNEAQFGQQSRETSNAAMQFATQQSNMIRRRLFNKYTKYVEAVYRDLLDIARTRWPNGKIISVLGKEKAFNTVPFKSSEIAGGYDLVVEFGTSLALDPISRRQEILQMMPFFEKAGIQPKALLRHIRLNELENLYDMATLGADRQQEIFDLIRTTGVYTPPEDLQDHQSMLEFAYTYIMTAQFKALPDNVREMIKKHIKDREQLATQQATGNLGGGEVGGEAIPPPSGESASPQPGSPTGSIPQGRNVEAPDSLASLLTQI